MGKGRPCGRRKKREAPRTCQSPKMILCKKEDLRLSPQKDLYLGENIRPTTKRSFLIYKYPNNNQEMRKNTRKCLYSLENTVKVKPLFAVALIQITCDSEFSQSTTFCCNCGGHINYSNSILYESYESSFSARDCTRSSLSGRAHSRATRRGHTSHCRVCHAPGGSSADVCGWCCHT